MNERIKAQLILENGLRFSGYAFGYLGNTVGEVVFNTGMTGYEELLTDPSYAGQFVVMTYPLIGNYGITLDDAESEQPRLKGFVVREKCNLPSNWRCTMDLDVYLKQNKITGIEDVDTRAITKILRDHGTMRGIIALNGETMSDEDVKKALDTLDNRNVIRECTIKEKYEIAGAGMHIAFLHMGAKNGLVKGFAQRGCKLSVFPAFTTAEEILAAKPDAVFLSNGPGDPKDVPEIIETVKTLMDANMPMLGVCMGNQLIGLALGGDTKKMKFGHHGGNHPVKDMKTGRVYITSQNHEYVVCNLPDDVEASFMNINDNTIEGLCHKTRPIYSVQFHPEASPGPLDVGFLFDRFIEIVERGGLHA